MELEGTDLKIIKTIKVGDKEVAIRSIDHQIISFVAPEVSEEAVVGVTLIYDNSIGANQQLSVAGTMTITPAVVPAVTSQFPASGESGETVSIEGTDLDIVTAIRLGDATVAISGKTGILLTFVAPAVEEETSLTVTLVYTNTLGADRELVLGESLVVKPSATPEPEPNVLKWENVIIGGQGTGLSFFNATTGEIITPCELFDNQTVVGFMMNVSTAGDNQFYNPSNAGNVLKNQLCGDLALGTEDGKNYSAFLAVSTKFRILSATGAQGTLAGKVRAGEIEEITSDLFTGISAPSSNTPKDFVVGNVVWFYNATKDKNGLIEIKAITPGATNGENTIKIDVYFQK